MSGKVLSPTVATVPGIMVDKLEQLEHKAATFLAKWFSKILEVYKTHPFWTIFAASVISICFWPCVFYLGFAGTIIFLFTLSFGIILSFAAIVGFCIFYDILLFACLCAGYIVLLAFGVFCAWKNFPLIFNTLKSKLVDLLKEVFFKVVKYNKLVSNVTLSEKEQ